MNFREYQQAAARTDSDLRNHSQRLIYGALGLSGEAGELVEAVKHSEFHGHEFDRENFIEELGDLLWYINYNAKTVGVSLEEIALRNIEKLKRRYPDGYSDQASIARVDVGGETLRGAMGRAE